ncbi:hypothetical protein CAEBREN_07139 [Caenorhabditis brenneri]|uniref:Uncharacterized protein n=1 Tax=Caenorhabditis brenneri TaxID=135651 RepID=G0NRC1_CAEBE|nr:hypothetical protein CAEBREN_07139 [Caenorhabditis brenneri]
MWPSESDLEPIDSIIDRMNPMPGFPYPMKSAINKGFPKSVGDPWIGAYTRNGYWFKLSWGGSDEWKEVANEMWYRNEFLNPEDDYDFDVDHLAIYRRTVNFFVFSSCESSMLPLLKKLAGSDGRIDKDRLTFQTCSNFQLPAINHDLIFALSDPNVFLC